MKKQIHLKIAVLRKNKGMTQQELGDAIGVSYQTVSKWENGVTMPDIGMLPVLSEYFHVTVDELLGMKPLAWEEYMPAKTDKKEYWENKLDYLLRTRKSHWNRDYMRFLIDQVWKLHSPVNVLDCGCGYGALGLMMMPLLPEGSTYTGVDFTEELIDQGNEMFLRAGVQGKFVTCDFIEYPLIHVYDVVICQSVLRHISRPEQFLTKMVGHGTNNALIVCIDTNREFECDGLYIDGMEYSYLCEHFGLVKGWKTELLREGRDYSIAMKTAHYMRKAGLKEIEVRMNDKVSFVQPEMAEYEQIVEDFQESNGYNYFYPEEQLEKTVEYMVNHGMSIREADGFLHKKQRIADNLKKNEGMACYTHVLGKMITFGRKV